jgi:hypothetical protein
VSKTRATTSEKSRSLQGRNAVAKRWNTPDRDDIAREYATQRITEFVKEVLDGAPELTDSQRTALAELLKPARRNGGAA